ncbi:MAG: YraN family protein [Anaerolineales bacterium]
MTTNTLQTLGKRGEDLAARYLEQHGFTILAVNYRTPYGELDLIAQKDALILFVEVKTRRSAAYGMPEEAITPRKKQHLLQSAQHYLQTNPPSPETLMRIDVIAIQLLPNQLPQIKHFPNVISE